MIGRVTSGHALIGRRRETAPAVRVAGRGRLHRQAVAVAFMGIVRARRGRDVDGKRGREWIRAGERRVDGGQRDRIGRSVASGQSGPARTAAEDEQRAKDADVHGRGTREPEQPARATAVAHLTPA